MKYRLAGHVAVLALLFVSVRDAAAADRQVRATVNGAANTLLGNLNVDVGLSGGSGKNLGTFTYDNANIGNLDDCYEMRWFQFITFDDAPAEYKGNKPIPVVDPPSGGWDYQAGSGGADTEPFYENSGNGAYAYPNYSARHTQNVKSWTDDFPFVPTGDGQKTVWQTWLVARPIGVDELCLLMGYEWEVGTKAGSKYGQFNKFINPADAATATMTSALTNSGFDKDKWPIHTDCELDCPSVNAVPEPATLAALGAGAVTLMRRRKRLPSA